ncbi:TfoX/Sxy family DNA transformation protein [Vibrio sp. SCSIO 43140]|uniref:TfoX/Sxy family DNA transformation protein n=1 Tax=Vibrio sp. SCSIO 43140 TaxID=2819100 RepID=UPI0020754D82|nr:TfoX/Sxy family DNA transformation protein [Vibrio sp. SCSIO 43140]USD62433.1 TfoX/Sxy family DNA transformation protein [Vibrio sp. SCSIO 43140]
MMLETFVESIEAHTTLDDITIRSVFGGKGVLSGGVIFALIKGDEVYLRASSESLKQEFIDSGCTPYEFNWRAHSRNYPSLSNYYSVPDSISHSKKQIASLCEEVWTAGLKEKIKKETPTRIKDLPNMQYKTERMLRKAGITSIDELREQGPVNAYKAVCVSQEKHPGVNLLFCIAGALEGIHWTILPELKRQSLTHEVGSDYLAH